MGVAWGRGYVQHWYTETMVLRLVVTNQIFIAYVLEQVLVNHQPQPRQPVGLWLTTQ